MTTHLKATPLFLAVLITLQAFGAPPPNPTMSDSFADTAGGSGALISLPAAPAGLDTAFGTDALTSESTGYWNSAFGAFTMVVNTSGAENIAIGPYSLNHNTSGSVNIAVGAESLSNNTTGNHNSALGEGALLTNVTGSNNTAVGFDALFGATSSNNIGVGYFAGDMLGSGGANIDVGNTGAAGDTGTIKIGNATDHKNTFIAGIVGNNIVGGAQVVINSSGKLGVVSSSERYKEGIVSMGDASKKLLDLRPVTFLYKADETKTRQYGLIAEEVAKVYPDLVLRNEHGQSETVLYQQLAPMLLNEMQKQAKELIATQKELDQLRVQHQKEIAELADLRSMLVAQRSVVDRLQSSIEQPVRVASR